MAKENQADARPNRDKDTEAWLAANDPNYGKSGSKAQKQSRKSKLARLAGTAPNPEDFPDTVEGIRAWAAASRAHGAATSELKAMERTATSKAKESANVRQRAAKKRGQTVTGSETIWDLGISAEPIAELATPPLSTPAGRESRQQVRAAARERRSQRLKGVKDVAPVKNWTISQPKAPRGPVDDGGVPMAGASTARNVPRVPESTKKKLKKQTTRVARPGSPTSVEDFNRLEEVARKQRDLQDPIKAAKRRQIVVTGEDLTGLEGASSERDLDMLAYAQITEAQRKSGRRIKTGDPAQTENVLPVRAEDVTNPVTGEVSSKLSEPYLGELLPSDKVEQRVVRFPGELAPRERQVTRITPLSGSKILGPGFSRSESERRGRGRGRRVRGLSPQEAALLATIEEGTNKAIVSTMEEMPFGQARRPGNVRIQGPGRIDIEEGRADDYLSIGPNILTGKSSEDVETDPAGSPPSPSRVVAPYSRRRSDITRPRKVTQKKGEPPVYTAPLKAGAPETTLQVGEHEGGITPAQFEAAWSSQSQRKTDTRRAQASALVERGARIRAAADAAREETLAREDAEYTPGTPEYTALQARYKALRGVPWLSKRDAQIPSSEWNAGNGRITTGPMINTTPPPTRELTAATAKTPQESELVTKVQDAIARGGKPVVLGMDLAGDVRSVARKQASAAKQREAAFKNLRERHAAGEFSTGEYKGGTIPSDVAKESAWESLRQRHAAGEFATPSRTDHFGSGATAHL